MCSIVDEQIASILTSIQVEPDLIPEIRANYTDEIARKLDYVRPDQRSNLERKLKDVDDEEARMARLYAAGKISERVWDNLWAEWQDRRHQIQLNLEDLSQKQEYHIANLDAALTIISKVGILYNKLERGSQKKLLREMVNRVVVSPKGSIQRMELLPPFAYLRNVTNRVRKGNGSFERKTTTSNNAGQCSDYLLLDTPDKNRTCASGSGGQRSIH